MKSADCPWCGNKSKASPCEHCGGNIEIPPASTEVVKEKTETGDDGTSCIMFFVGLALAGLFALLIAGIFKTSEPTRWSAPNNVSVFTPDYILNNNVPSLLPNMVICPNGKINRTVDGQGTCDFSDSHLSSLAGGPSWSPFPFGDAYDTTASFVWAYNLPDLNAIKVAQVPWGTSFRWQGCYEIDSGSPDIGGGILYWTFVYGYGWIDSYQVIGGCQIK